MKMRTWLTAVSVLGALLAPTVTHAEPAPYRQPTFDGWDTPKLDIIIAPPAHGQVYNANGPLNNLDPAEVGPGNSYVRATEDSIAE